MARGPRSSNRSRRSATPSTNSASTWRPLVDTRRSPSNDGLGSHGSPYASNGHMSLPSSEGEHSPGQGSPLSGGEPWPEALQQTNTDSEADNSEESVIGDQRIPIAFNDNGQPIGPTRRTFSTKLGKITRNLASPGYITWKDVLLPVKESIWKSITNDYMVPQVLKDKVLKRAHKAWKNSKTPLRLICDKYTTVAEMKNNRPGNVRKEDWEKFVDMVNKDEDRVIREKMKRARKELKALHSIGRVGIASRREEMEKQNPIVQVTRVDLYLVTHVYQEVPEEDLANLDPLSYEKTVRELYAMEENRNETPLDKDAVAKTFGVDGRGTVRGMGGGVSKTELRASAVSREQLRQEKLKTVAVETRVCGLEETVEELRQLALNANPSTSNPSNAQQMNVGGRRIQNIVLRNMRWGAVAFGRIDRIADENDAF
ncbi:uncharacterized protein LOC113275733 isoform X1 [Papaver somniferum]|uniref:uncharacterized protein LOC113275733 isoform X1 n=1 Tax=Papaver somniferum TaxID=3469 RepID=UPI000E7054D5|nr:uncharacterized protein LOC113275733 isoform X1 [Papaver somniferum]